MRSCPWIRWSKGYFVRIFELYRRLRPIIDLDQGLTRFKVTNLETLVRAKTLTFRLSADGRGKREHRRSNKIEI